MIEKPLVIIGGSKGKFSTCKYFSFISHQLYKYNILSFKYSETYRVITEIKINDKEILNLGDLRRDVVFHPNFDFNDINEEISLINYICIRYNIDFIVSNINSLIKFGKVISCGLTTVEYHESQNLDYSLEEIFKIREPFVYSVENSFFNTNVPIIMCPQEKIITNKILDKCLKSNTPVFMTNFYHLKYINFNTGVNSRYSYINLIVALNILAYLNTIYNIKTKELEDFRYLRYKQSTYGNYRVYLGIIPNKLPILKNINFDLSYCGIKKYNKNLCFYLDNGGSFKSSNLLIDWFNKNVIKKGVNICIFSCDTDVNLIRTILPLTTIEFETLYIADYNLFGRNVDDLFEDFDMGEKYKYKLRPQVNNWTETMYELFNLFYTDKKYRYGRKKASIQLNEYAGFEEIKIEKPEDIYEINLPDKNPDIVVDDLKSIFNWITRISIENSNIQYNVLATGSKFLLEDLLFYINDE
jgi:hypothetical protein